MGWWLMPSSALEVRPVSRAVESNSQLLTEKV